MITIEAKAIIKHLTKKHRIFEREDSNPFFNKEDEPKARFDQLVIYHTRVEFWYKGEKIGYLDTPDWRKGDSLTLTGIYMETDISVTST